MKKIWIAIILALGVALLIAGLASADGVKDFEIKVGDIWPYYTAQAVNSSNVAIDISADTITAKVENKSTGQEIVVDGACTITNGTLGYFEYRWADGQTNTAGSYAIEFKRISGGKQSTLPTRFDAIVKINERY